MLRLIIYVKIDQIKIYYVKKDNEGDRLLKIEYYRIDNYLGKERLISR